MSLDTRAAAAQVLGAVLGGKSLNQALATKALRAAEQRDRAFVQQLCYGTLRQAPRLQAVLKLLLKKPLRDKDRDLQGLLLAGLYQLELTRVPDHAAVDATVKATVALKKNWARGLTNAVLRRYLRERDVLTQALDKASAAAHPQWLYKKIRQQWPQDSDRILRANNEQAPMTLRVNAQRYSQAEYLQLLLEHEIKAHIGALCRDTIYLQQPLDVQALPGFSAGAVSVQDEAAQVAADLLETASGERVLDACAAPGGKACHILERVPGLAQLVAMDSDEKRLALVADNLQRLKLSAQLVCADATQPAGEWFVDPFDRILVDAPCSATGVIRRHPDIKVLRRPEDIAALADQQLSILRGLWPLLRPGGTLLYATCSILDEENSQVVERFVQLEKSAKTVSIDADWGEKVARGRQLLPGSENHDGLFYSLLCKAS